MFSVVEENKTLLYVYVKNEYMALKIMINYLTNAQRQDYLDFMNHPKFGKHYNILPTKQRRTLVI